MENEATTTEQVQSKPSIEDYAAYEYQNLLPQFYQAIDDLSNRQLKKVVQAIMEYPLQTVEFRWSYEKEKKAFLIGTKILDCRFVLTKAVLEMNKEQIQELIKNQVEEPKPQEETVIIDQT